MDIRNFFKGGASKKKTQKKSGGSSGADDSKKAVTADDFYTAMAEKDTKKENNSKQDPKPVARSPARKKVTPKASPEKEQKNDSATPTSTPRVSPRKRGASPQKVSPRKESKTSPLRSPAKKEIAKSPEVKPLAPKSTPVKKEATPSPKNKPLARKSSPGSPSKGSAKKSKKTVVLEPKLSQESFDTDLAASECLLTLTFVFSGVLPKLSRDDAQEMVKELGGRVTTAVSSRTDYLVVGETLEDGRDYTEGSKYKKALEHKTHVLKGEPAFFGLLQQYSDYIGKNRKVSPAPTKPANPYAAKKPAANPYANPYAKAGGNPYAKSSANPYAAKKPATASVGNSDVAQEDVVSIPSGSNNLWVDRYKPRNSREILGNTESVRKLANWLMTWERKFNSSASIGKSFSNPNGPFKVALLSGPPGIGKTTTATIIAKEANRDVIEFNASDVRSKKALKENLGDITGSNTIEFGKPKKQGASKRTKRCIIMDEVDGMGAGDRSGMSELIQLIKNSRVPIICICNDRQSQKMKSLVPYCLDLRYRRPTKVAIAKRAMEIAIAEGFTVEQSAAEAIADSCGNDVRQVLNCMQMWASNNKVKDSRMTYKNVKERQASINKDEILRVSLFDAARNILEGRRGLNNASPEAERASFYRRTDSFFVDYSFVGLLVQQNYLKVTQGQFLEAKRSNDPDKMATAIDNMASAAESMSDLAVAEHSLRGDQNWGLLPFCSVLTLRAGFHAGGPNGGMLPGFPEFTTWLGRNSTKGKKQRILDDLNHHMNYRISGGTQEMRMSYIPVFRDRFLSLIADTDPDGVTNAIKLMDEYGLDRDDIFEKMEEFGIGSKSASFSKIDSKKKAAFTRTYNSGSHTSQALVAAQGSGGKKKRGSAAATSETKDPDAIDDDKVEDEEPEDEEEDLEKLKAMFKKKGRKKAAPKKKKAATKKK